MRTCVERRRTILRNVDTVRALVAGQAPGLRAPCANDGSPPMTDSPACTFVAADYRALFRRFLKDVRERTIVICHPAVDEAPGDRIVAARIREYAYLEQQMPADLAEAGVRVGRFATLLLGRHCFEDTPAACSAPSGAFGSRA